MTSLTTPVATLFDPLCIRGVRFRNRIGVAPMCQTAACNGFVNDWHLVHLGTRAVGGAALVIAESTAITPDARITDRDLGLWCDEQISGHERLCRFIVAAGSVPGVQLGHAGRKSSYCSPWDSDGMRPLRGLSDPEGAWPIAGPSMIAFDENTAVPREMTTDDIEEVIRRFSAAAGRAIRAGYQLVEIHAAHGYLLHSFCSPLSNHRTDGYGGTLERRTRLCREVARAVRRAIPDDTVLAFRISHTDWVTGGWSTEESVELARMLRDEGVDLIDVSSGGTSPAGTLLARHLSAAALAGKSEAEAVIPVAPGYQLPGARAVRNIGDIAVAAVGLITEPEQADRAVRAGMADMVLLGRELLRDPYWPIRAAGALGATDRMDVPCQYFMAWRDRGPFSYRPVDVSQHEPDNGAMQ